MDELFVNNILKEVTNDLNLVAKRKASLYISQIYTALDLTRLPNITDSSSQNERELQET